MIRQDTVRLLRECDAGIRMGVDAISDVLPKVQSKGLEQCLSQCVQEHEGLNRELQALLSRCHDQGKAPNLMARAMSKMKTVAKLSASPSDQTVADLMTDGCNMGVKSLNKYLNQYKAADEASKELARRLIDSEHRLALDLRQYL